MSDIYDYPDADAIPPVKPNAPHPLTREQVGVRRYAHRPRLADMVMGQPADMPAGEYVCSSDYDALRQALTQQAQEVERLRTGQGISSAEMDLSKQLAAMTAERDAWQKSAQQYNGTYESLQQQLAASQQKVRELETCQCEGCDNSLEGSAYCEPCFVKLQATLAEREAALLDATSTALALNLQGSQLEANLDTARQDAARLREALDKAVAIARRNTYMSKNSDTGGNFGGSSSCEYGCGGVIADAITVMIQQMLKGA